MQKYQFYGSSDSTDIDVMFFVDKIGSIQEQKETIENIKESLDFTTDVHLAVLSDGVVVDVSHGTIDEVNNMLYYTYENFDQPFYLQIERPLQRDIILKCTRAFRAILSMYSRVESLRHIIKPALKGDLATRMNAALKINLVKDIPTGRNLDIKTIYKVIAFQIAQAYGLIEGIEIYTKQEAIKLLPELEEFIYRYDNVDLNKLDYYVSYLEIVTSEHFTDDELKFIEPSRK